MEVVRYARDHDIRVAVRSGGHNGAGLGSVDGGLVIDLSPMHGVIVDQQTKTARVQAGALLGDVDHATHAFGLAVPAGIISTTGVGGLTLGGGLGHITRRCGLTVDNLLSAEVVLANGTPVTASPHQNEDLFWALLDHRLAVRLLVARVDQRVQRKRIIVRRGDLFFQESAEHTRFRGIQLPVHPFSLRC